MNTLQRMLQIIDEESQKRSLLTTQETLHLFESLKSICADKILIKKTIDHIVLLKKTGSHLEALTKRENQIFQLVGIGFQSKEISLYLNISIDTVSTHRKKIIKKLGLSGTGQLQKTAQQYTLERK